MNFRKLLPFRVAALFFMAAGLFLTTSGLTAIDHIDTRLMSQPAISDSHIAFIYANDLWVANSDGSNPRRLTVDKGVESGPYFSPDGKLITFSAEYDGNRDVFILPVEGGIPAATYLAPGHATLPEDSPWTEPACSSFPSARCTPGATRSSFTVPVEGGFPTRLEIPNAFHACYSPDGSSMVYSPVPDVSG